jgi:hypothetical protein
MAGWPGRPDATDGNAAVSEPDNRTGALQSQPGAAVAGDARKKVLARTADAKDVGIVM